jgi:ABC-2 type transport system permease protein
MSTITNYQPLNRPRLYWFFADSFQLCTRSLLHIRQDLDQLMGVTLEPIIFLLMLRYVLGGSVETGSISYPNFLVAGMLVMNTALNSTTTAVGIATDLHQGIIDRFRSLPMVKSSVLVGHITADLLRSLISITITVAVGLFVGFQPQANPAQWLAVIGLLFLLTLALSTASAIIGILGKSLEFVQQVSFLWIMPLMFLSGIVAPTYGMPHWLRLFADNQPFSQVVIAVRSLLLGEPAGNHIWLAAVWLTGIIVIGFLAASWLFRRKTM